MSAASDIRASALAITAQVAASQKADADLADCKAVLVSQAQALTQTAQALRGRVGKRNGDISPAIPDTLQSVAAVLTAEVTRLSNTGLPGIGSALHAQAEALGRIAADLEAPVPPPPPPPPPPDTTTPAGYTLVWKEDFSAPTFINGVKKWAKMGQEGNEATHASRILQLDGTGDEDGGEGVQGATDGRCAAIMIPVGWNYPSPAVPAIVTGWLGNKPSVYLRFRFKLNQKYAHYQGAKIGLLWGNGANANAPLFLSTYPLGGYTTQLAAQSRPVAIRVGLQGVIPPPGKTGTWNATPNLIPPEQATLTRGAWQTIDLECIGNSPGKPDGILRMKLDGKPIMEYADCGFFGGGNAPNATGWAAVKWTPTHSGFPNGEGYATPAYQYMDEVTAWSK